MTERVSVWDPLVRLFHWGLVLSFAIAWLSADHLKAVHELAGYVAGGLVAFRLVWGVLGTRYARFLQFLRSPWAVLGYLGDIAQGRERRYLGHNPAGGAMIAALIIAMAALATTGWMQTTDQFFGVEWVEEVHEALANVLLLLVGLHILGVLVASYRHRENLPLAMLTGRKRAPSGDDVA